MYYGQCENGEYSCGDRLAGGDLVNAQTWHVFALEILDGLLNEGVKHSYHSENNSA